MIALMDAVNRPNVGAIFDTYHTLHRNEVPTDYVHRLGKRLRPRALFRPGGTTMKRTLLGAPLALALSTQAMAKDTVVLTQWDQFAQSGTTAPDLRWAS